MQATSNFYFYSDFARKQMLDREGQPAGRLHDVALEPGDLYPKATHLILRWGLLRPRYAAVPWEGVEAVLATIQLGAQREGLVFEPTPPPFDFTLVRDILDQQVVDTNGQKVIRVNDVNLLQVERELRISHVDVGIRGIVRRLGWQWWADAFAETFLARTDYLKDNLINWRYVQPLAIHPQKGTLKLTIDQKQIAMIPHADFSDMMQRMDVNQRLALFKSVAPEFQPRLFSDLPLDIQRELLENLDLREAAELLSRVPADQSADLLEEVPKSVADSLLALMETTQARRLSTLLGYTSDSAGGLMTTEMITVPKDARVADVLAKVRLMQEHLENATYAFLVEGENRLAGQVLLKRLLVAEPGEPALKHAYPKPVYVRSKDSLREVAFVMEKYKLPAVPVVNNGRERLLQGVITIDDILARVIPLAWRRRAKLAT